MRTPRSSKLTVATVGALLFAAAGFTPVALASVDETGTTQTYLVVFNGSWTDSAAIDHAGGTVVVAYDQIGVAVARSDRAGFAASLRQVAGVDGVSATEDFGVRVADAEADAAAEGATAAANWGDTLSAWQWDMTQIKVPEAHAVTTGSPNVIVADLDTGLDFTHPDLGPNYDASRTDCSSGTPTPLLAGNDRNGHGTHTAGTIAAAANGIGIVGVAPSVKIAGVKTSNDDGFFFPEMVVCAYMWAATHGIDITNNSYFADPWLFNCLNDKAQRAIWTAERRAIRYAQSRGTLVIASEGNQRIDLSHPRIDTLSPDFPPDSAVVREITNAYAVVPVEVPGVLSVSATGARRLKASYSSYGVASVAAPGGDATLQDIAADTVGRGRVLSTYPSDRPCARARFDNGAKYCYLQGTSMAGPHAVGVAALIKALRPNLSGGALGAAVQQAVTPLACPDASIYANFPQPGGFPQTCDGGVGHTSFHGSGEVNALSAVS